MYEVLVTGSVLAHTVLSAIWTAQTCLLLSNIQQILYMSQTGHVITIRNKIRGGYRQSVGSILQSFMLEAINL